MLHFTLYKYKSVAPNKIKNVAANKNVRLKFYQIQVIALSFINTRRKLGSLILVWHCTLPENQIRSDVFDAIFSELKDECTANELSSSDDDDDVTSTSVKELLVPTFLPRSQTSKPGIKEVDSKEESFVSKEDELVTNSAENTHTREVECSTCSRLFLLNEIADHADLCAAEWTGTVEDEAVLITGEETANCPSTADDIQIPPQLRMETSSAQMI